MNMEELLQLGAKAFSQSNLSGDAGTNLDLGSLTSALTGLTGGGEGNFDIGSLVENFTSGGLGELASSWLGDGENTLISPEQITNILGADKIEEFASQLGLSSEEASGGLSEALPQMIDQASSGGSLLESLGGVEGILGMAGKLFGR